MNILHAADIHACRDRWAEARASLRAMGEAARAKGCDLVVLSGDLAHGPLQDSERDIFDALCAELQALADIAPVALIYGTPGHDAPGSLEVFEKLKARFPIRILRPGIPYFLSSTGNIEAEPWSKDNPVSEGEPRLLLFGIPEPSKKWLLANGGATGKDETDNEVRQAMRALCFGLGGLRREHSELPCLILYHGEIAGSRTATGYQSEAGTGFAITRDELEAIGADYCALGHIHEPQRVSDLPAYYAGSAYPIKWDETHKAGCNLVEIDPTGWGDGGRNMTVSRIDFPHPQRQKVPTTWTGESEIMITRGCVNWLEITCTRDEAADIDTDAILAHIIEGGALPGSRVTLNVLPTETTRAGEIVEKKCLRDKVQVWGEASSTALSDTVLAKADELEREAASHGGAGDGAHIRIDRLRLKGAIGIWKKSKKDEVDLDLAALGPGVLALVGPNGHGKTTILENMHPWPCMLTRDGTLKDHFRLKDSARDLHFTDLRTGFRYRALINVRADILSGAAEYFLFRDSGDGQGLQPVEGVTGRKEPYEAAVARLFGSLEMFLQTAFQTQRPNRFAPDLGAATQGQRKTLFGELSGIDYLEGYRTACKARADGLEGDLRVHEATIAAAADVDEALARAGAEIGQALADQAAAEQDAAYSVERGRGLRAQADLLASRVAEIDRRAERARQVDRELAEISALLGRIEAEIAGFQEAAAGRDAAEAELAHVAELEREAAGLRAEKARLDGDYQAALLAYQDETEGARLHSQTLQRDLDAARKAYSAADQALAVARARLVAPVAETCPTCGQRLPADRLEAIRHAHEEAEAKVRELEAVASGAAAAVKAAETAYFDDARAFSERRRPDPAPFPGAARLSEILLDLDFADRPGLEATLAKAREAAVRIEEAGRRKADAEGRRASLEGERAGVAPRPEDAGVRDELAARQRDLSLEQERYAAAKGAIEAAKARGEAAARAQADAERRRAARDEAAGKRDAAALERDDWRLLERATGPNGIQALELDALAPSIVGVANGILSGAFGSRYQIEIRTQREAGKGSKAKMVEDFEIYILDTETGDEQTIDSLSGGESVWIRKALYDAFAIIRARNTGTQFATVALDEADGALDPESRMLYLRMLEAAHRESGRYQTIIVTHSRELQAMVERTIDVAALGSCETKDESEAAA